VTVSHRAASIEIFPLELPFVESFRHATSDRTACDSVLVKLTLENGVVGWGEGVPRAYVTGETQDSVVEHVTGPIARALFGRAWSEPVSTGDIITIGQRLPTVSAGGVLAANAAHCAVELALVDALLRSAKASLADVLIPAAREVHYSAAITATSVEGTEKVAKRLKLVGFRDWKVKVGFDDDDARLSAVRAIIGEDASLRVDANGAWSLDEAEERLARWKSFGIETVEEPLGRARRADLALLKAKKLAAVSVDESLVTDADATALFRDRSCDMLNLRLSKLGGLASTLRMATTAHAESMDYQVGCQVGETAILSAVGRHLAAHLVPRYVEGSFGAHLLAEDIGDRPVTFGHRGIGQPLGGPGFGVNVREDRVRAYAKAVHSVDRGSLR
jgi:L-alanine-DL-glutamate epimerase-like enolase superfamily enzyme